eukprot:jgi/Mesvir1/10762/Mv13829-RA.2
MAIMDQSNSGPEHAFGAHHGLAVLLDGAGASSTPSVVTRAGRQKDIKEKSLDDKLRWILEIPESGNRPCPMLCGDSAVDFVKVQHVLHERLACIATACARADIEKGKDGDQTSRVEEEISQDLLENAESAKTAPGPHAHTGQANAAKDGVSGGSTSARGRLGPETVRMHWESWPAESIRFDNTGLRLESHGNFSSARANVCVMEGRWMYEVILGSSGILQIGWVTIHCPYTHEEGVGDAPDSYAYDGKRVAKWSVECTPYGQPWVAGDIIGCCIDLDEGQVSFMRNGVHLGVAFSNIRRKEKGLAYFPAISLSHGESCTINFGARPLAHPLPGFLPLQPPPPATECEHARYLLGCLERLASLAPEPASPCEHGEDRAKGRVDIAADATCNAGAVLCRDGKGQADQDAQVGATCADKPRGHESTHPATPLLAPGSLTSEDTVLLASVLSEPLAPLLCKPYTACAALVPFLLSLDRAGQAARDASGRHLFGPAPDDSMFTLDYVPGRVQGGGAVPGFIPHVSLDRAALDYVDKERGKERANAVAPSVEAAASPPAVPRLLARVVDLLAVSLEPWELGGMAHLLMEELGLRSRCAFYEPRDWPRHAGAYPFLSLACALLRCQDVLTAWVISPDAGRQLEELFCAKQPNREDLAALLPSVWWREGAAEEACPPSNMMSACSALSHAVAANEGKRLELCGILLRHVPPPRQQLPCWHCRSYHPRHLSPLRLREGAASDGDAALTSALTDAPAAVWGVSASVLGVNPLGPPVAPASSTCEWLVADVDPDPGAGSGPGGPRRPQDLFSRFLGYLLRRNRKANSNFQPPGLSDPSTLLCVYLSLLRLLPPAIQGLRPEAFPARDLLASQEAVWLDVPCLGGTLSHLLKTLPLPAPPAERGPSGARAARGESQQDAAPRDTGASLEATDVEPPQTGSGPAAGNRPDAARAPDTAQGSGQGAAVQEAAAARQGGSAEEQGAGAGGHVPSGGSHPSLTPAASVSVSASSMTLTALSASSAAPAAAAAREEGSTDSTCPQRRSRSALDAGPSGLHAGGRMPGEGGTDAGGAGFVSITSAPGLWQLPPEPSGWDDLLLSASDASKFQLFHAMLLLFHFGVASVFKKASQREEVRSQAISQLAEKDASLRGRATEASAVDKKARASLRKAVVESVRECAWDRVCLYQPWKLHSLAAVTRFSCNLLNVLSEMGKGAVGKAEAGAAQGQGGTGAGGGKEGGEGQGDGMQSAGSAGASSGESGEEASRAERGRVLPYVPELYVETLVDAFHILTEAGAAHEAGVVPASHGPTAHGFIIFLVLHADDARIVNPDMHDLLLQSITFLLRYADYLAALEANEVARTQLVPMLLRVFDSNFWIPASNILLRLTCGAGLEKRWKGVNQSPSTVFQRRIREAWRGDPALVASFLNRMFNTLNWTISELSVAAEGLAGGGAPAVAGGGALASASQRRQAQERQQTQRKATAMLDLSSSLERLLEFFTRAMADAFLVGPEVSITRLCEIVMFVLSQSATREAAARAGAGKQAARLDGMDLAHVLNPLVGILVNLKQAEDELRGRADRQPGASGGDEAPPPVRFHSIVHSLAQSCPNADSLEYLLKFPWDETKCEAPSPELLHKLGELVVALREEIEHLKHHTAQLAADKVRVHTLTYIQIEWYFEFWRSRWLEESASLR